MTVLAFAGGSFIFLGVVVALFVAVAYGFYSVKGSAINQHPNDGLDGSPGSAGPNEVGKGRSSEDHGEEATSAGGEFSTHGTG